jgi:hypothetical protein
MPEKLNRVYGATALISFIFGISLIAVLKAYFSISSLYGILLLILGVCLLVVAGVFVFFFFTLQWRWTHGQPQPRPMG